ncbi:MAG: hypothetical protein KF851_03205 [Pirellulaceae bacterium]|nr:hypothetical protein [Pirellulaceae bacterium]
MLELAQLYQLERQEQERLEREFPVEECLENDRKVNDWKLAKVAELKDSAHLFRRVEEVPGFSKELGELLDSHFEQCENCSIVQKQRRKARKVKEEKERLEAEIEKLKK